LPVANVATAKDVENELKRIDHTFRHWRSSWSIPAPGQNMAGRITSIPAAAMGYEATMYLLERGVRLTGIDGLELGCAVRLYREEIR